MTLPVLGGTVAGTIILTDSHDPGVRKKNDFAGVAVWLTSPIDPPVNHTMRHVIMLQQNKSFSPHILVIRVGTIVDFPNVDPIFHNAFSNFDGQIFDIGLYPPGSSRSVRFDRPGIVRIFCNIHPSMSAIIVVVDSPYFAKTNKTGSFSLRNVQPGAYDIHFFHERATPEVLQRLSRTVSVAAGTTQLNDITISESGYLPVGHKNKYGLDYPQNAGEQPDYMLR